MGIALFRHRRIRKERGETGIFYRETAPPPEKPGSSLLKENLFPPFLGQPVSDCPDSPVFVPDPAGWLVYVINKAFTRKRQFHYLKLRPGLYHHPPENNFPE